MNTHVQIALVLIVVAGAGIFGAVVSELNQRATVTLLKEELTKTKSALNEIAEVTDRNGADEALSTAIKDCERRTEYESLLVKLGELSKKDLVTVQNLFEGCGDFHATQKALMVGKFELVFSEYETLVRLLETMSDSSAQDFNAETYGEIVAHERLRSDLLHDLYVIQADIISELIQGGSTQSPRVRELVSKAQDIGQLLIVYDRQIDEWRRRVTGG